MLLKRFLFLLIGCLAFNSLQAQLYTDDNRVNIMLEGHKQLYDYSSENMLVRLDESNGKLECIVNIATLHGNNNQSDPVIPYDVFYARKYPQFRIVMHLPMDLTTANNHDNLINKSLTVKAQLYFQGLTRDIEIPIQLTSDRNYISFNTSFNFTLKEMQALVPQIYMNMLTGLIRVNIVNATWVDSRLVDPDKR